ncbi:hypothetical protein CspeluHIS016_0302620 [Cutaneotrichosporon spelunceum]|uniref:DUF3824 domain-containing protein n=1 Tax=Cutaneotrichosporon spelunceum TaxID=1672016 RepID=A0AAD3YBZ3_9TREE|nr:hypothetical protein CspeluHIS016_0302620 [Cutaneotrichosporon spelunceum]
MNPAFSDERREGMGAGGMPGGMPGGFVENPSAGLTGRNPDTAPGTITYGSTDPINPGFAATGQQGFRGAEGHNVTGHYDHGPGTTKDKVVDKVTPGTNTYGTTDPANSGSAVTGQHGAPGSEGRNITSPGTTKDKIIDKITPGTNTYGTTDPANSGSAVTGERGAPGSEGRYGTGAALGGAALGAGAGGLAGHEYREHHSGPGTAKDKVLDKVTPGTNTYGTTDPMNSGSAVTGRHGAPGSEGRYGTGAALGGAALGAGAASVASHEYREHHTGPGTTKDKAMDKVTPGTNTYGTTDPMHSGSAVTGRHGVPGSEGRGLNGREYSQHHTTSPATTKDKIIDKITPGTNTYGTTDPANSGSAVTGERGAPGSEGRHHGTGTALGAGAGAGGLAAHEYNQHHVSPGTTGDRVMDKVTPGTNTYGTTDPMNSGSAVTGRHGAPGSEGHRHAAGTTLGAGALGAGAGGLAAHEYNQHHVSPGTTGDRVMDKVTPGTNTYGTTDPMNSGSAVTGRHGVPGSEGHRTGGTHGVTDITALPAVERSPNDGSSAAEAVRTQGMTSEDARVQNALQNMGISKEEFRHDDFTPVAETDRHHTGTAAAVGTGVAGDAALHGTHRPGTTTDKAIDKVTPGTNTYGSTDPAHSGSAVTGKHGVPGSEGHTGTGLSGTRGPGTTGDKMMDKVTPGTNTYGTTDPMHSGSAVTGRHGAPGSEGHHHAAGTALGAGALGAGTGGLGAHEFNSRPHGSGPGTTGDKMMDKVTPGTNTYGTTDPMNSGSAVTGRHGAPGSEGHYGTGAALGGAALGAGAGGLAAHEYNQHRSPGTTGDKVMDKVTPGTNTYGTTDPMHSGSAVTGRHGEPGSEGHRSGAGTLGVGAGGLAAREHTSGTTGSGPGTTGDKIMDKVTPGTNTYGTTDPLHSGSAVTGQHGVAGSEGRIGTHAGSGRATPTTTSLDADSKEHKSGNILHKIKAEVEGLLGGHSSTSSTDAAQTTATSTTRGANHPANTGFDGGGHIATH